ncbi:MAG: DHH family phosphoesterase [Aminivibrio sp.]|jgi:phosphoesterase RecJ-like protein
MTPKSSFLTFAEAGPRIIDILKRASRWIILSHIKPDGDTLGCGAAFYSLGLSMEKEVRWGGPDPMPEGYRFLAGSEDYVPGLALDSLAISKADAVIALDTSTLARSVAGLESLDPAAPLLNIDHHQDNEGFGTTPWVDPAASSVGEMCWELFEEWGIFLPPEAADALYVAIATDTGNFVFAGTTPQTHRAAAGLLALGVKPARLDQMIKCGRTMGGLKLRGSALNRVTAAGPFGAITWIGREDFKKTGGDPSETESLVNELLTIKTVSFAALLTEEEDGVRASLRSRGALSASDVAKVFGGGGHLQAAGCTLPLPLDEAVKTLKSYIEENNVSLRSFSAC